MSRRSCSASAGEKAARARPPRATSASEAIPPCRAVRVPRLGDHVVDHQPDLPADQFAQLAVARRAGITALDRAPLLGDEIERQQFVELEEPGAQAIVDVVIVIGDIVGQRGDLRLQDGPLRAAPSG